MTPEQTLEVITRVRVGRLADDIVPGTHADAPLDALAVAIEDVTGEPATLGDMRRVIAAAEALYGEEDPS